MEQAKVVRVEVLLKETAERTDATASLRLRQERFVAWGRARRNASDPNVPQIGEQLAVARALAGLSQRLLEAATAQIEELDDQQTGARR